jgi:hypothetical protein
MKFSARAEAHVRHDPSHVGGRHLQVEVDDPNRIARGVGKRVSADREASREPPHEQ